MNAYAILSDHAAPINEAVYNTVPYDPGARPRVFILSDVRLYREGLALSLSQRPEIEVVGAAASAAETLMTIADSAASAALLDVAMPDALRLPKELVRLVPEIKVIAFAVADVEHELIAYAEAGIVGYVPRDGSTDDVILSIQHALCGELICSPRLAGILLQRVARLSTTAARPFDERTLTAREREIMDLAKLGRSNKQIARLLSISPATVKNHVHNVLEKLQVNRRGEAAACLNGEILIGRRG
jgi:two-component system, NarL family, nitrate/nitrite response regulator NarL